jgi:hypothetical protein
MFKIQKKINDIIGLEKQMDYTYNTLNDNNNSTIFFYGTQSCGKSLISSLIFQKLNIVPYYFNTTNNDTLSYILNICHTDFNYLFSNKKTKRKKIGIIIDNIDQISIFTYKKQIFELISHNLIYKKFPLIIIAKNKDNMLISEIEKYTKITINKLHFSLIKSEIEKIIMTSFKINISKSDTKLLLSKTNYNIKMSENILYIHSITNLCLSDILKIYLNDSKQDVIFDSIDILLRSEFDYKLITNLYNKHKVVLPLIIHENLHKIVHGNTKLLLDIYKIMSYGDFIENCIYSEQIWSLKHTHCFITCVQVILLILNNKSKKVNVDELQFSSELNKNSLKNINKKNFTNLKKMTSLNKSQLLYYSNSLTELLTNENYSKINDLLSHIAVSESYRLRIIELLLKIDKCNQLKSKIHLNHIKKKINI